MPTAAPKKAAIGAMVKSADVASLAKSFQALKARLAETEAKLESERRDRESDADTIAQMLVRIVALERSLRDAAAASVRARDSRPPGVDSEALRRIAALEARAEEAEARARNAEARANTAEGRARVETERAETLGRDHDALRNKLADAEVRARSEHDRAAHADEVARAAKARAIELAERLELATPSSRDLSGELRAERERHQRELEDIQQRNAAALRDAHDAYADAFRETLEQEREIAREEIEQEHAWHRDAAARITELEDRLRSLESKHASAVAEIERLSFDRDAADRQSRLAAIQLQAAEAKLELVDKQLEWAEESAALVRDGRTAERDAALPELIGRLAAARNALFVDEAAPNDTKPPPLPGRRRSTRPPRRS